MTSSIRTFLLINLLLTVIIITSLAIVGNLFLAHQDIQGELDAQLSRTSKLIQVFVDNTSPSQLKEMQNNFNKITEQTSSNATLNQSNSHTAFQIWNASKHLILRSPNAPTTPFSTLNKTQFTNNIINHIHWRVRSFYSKKNQLNIIVASRSDYRQQLEDEMTNDSIIIMLITFPFLTLLIWFIVGKALRSVKMVTNELKHRAPSYLEPVDLALVPTEVKPLILELNELFSRLKTAFERHERFTSDAAHELRTPLAALSAHAQVALRSEAPQDRNEALLKVLGGVNRCSHVVQQLLTFSRMCPEAGLNNPVEVSITNQAVEVAAMLAPEAIAKNVELELVNPDNKPMMIGNTTAIGILIRNLVDNAIRYSDEDSYVKIDITETDNTIVLRVIDNGPGIPQELRDRVFERFFRVIGNKSPGSGLGLGIVQQIVRLHQGKIELLTAPGGKGLEIKITFPKDCQKL
jgi:two-component system, OmpR family, sensor histidine kinase QseC